MKHAPQAQGLLRAAVLCMVLVAAGCSGEGAATGDAERFDVSLRGGTVVDGTGAARFEADIGIRGDEIVAIGDLASASAARVIEEQIELARELPDHQGIFIPHLRSQGIAPMWYLPSVNRDKAPPTLDDALNEALAVAEATGARVVLTHMKAWGPGYRGQAQRIVDKLVAARARGLDLFMDVYPYDSSGSDGSFVALPDWAFQYGDLKPGRGFSVQNAGAAYDYTAVFRQVLAHADAGRLDDLARDVRHTLALKGGPENVRILEYPNADYVGKTFAELMALRGMDEPSLAIALQLEGNRGLPGGAMMRSFSMAEDDIATFYRQPWCATSTDGWVVLPEEAQGHLKYVDTNRRVFGSYPRRLAHYSRDLGVDTLEQAVRSSSGLPAEILRLSDRGRIGKGMKADVVVIAMDDLRDNTTYAEPSVYPDGIDYVLVNGQFVVDGGARTLALPGRVLKRVGAAAEVPPKTVQ